MAENVEDAGIGPEEIFLGESAVLLLDQRLAQVADADERLDLGDEILQQRPGARVAAALDAGHAADGHLHAVAKNALVVGVVAVIVQFALHEQQADEAAGDPQPQAEDIDQRMELVASQPPERLFDQVFNHGSPYLTEVWIER